MPYVNNYKENVSYTRVWNYSRERTLMEDAKEEAANYTDGILQWKEKLKALKKYFKIISKKI